VTFVERALILFTFILQNIATHENKYFWKYFNVIKIPVPDPEYEPTESGQNS
jgi:hypothetical protein